MFKFSFPTRTARSGIVRANSANDGSGQGRGSSKRFGHCQQCGMVNNFLAIDTSGGSLDGNGSRGPITKVDSTGTTLRGDSITQKYGDAVNRKGAGCALCGSKNASKFRPFRRFEGQFGRSVHLGYRF